MKTSLCNYSEFKIYPARGMKFVRSDSKVFHFVNTKVESLFFRKINPRDIRWSMVYRRIYKNTTTDVSAKKKARKAKKVERNIVGASLEVIQQKRAQKPEVKQAAAEQAKREIKEKKKAATTSTKKVASKK